MSLPHPPKAPTDKLRLESFRVLSRLQLIFEFRPWLEYTRDYIPEGLDTPLKLLWQCFAYGPPLGTLLNLLGSPTPRDLVVDANTFDFAGVSINDRRMFLVNLIQRVQLLEVQGQISYGEVVRVEDFLYSSNATFSKVLQTVNRLLASLQETYPGLFVVPHRSEARKMSLYKQLIDSERIHVSKVLTVVDSASKLLGSMENVEATLEGFIVHAARICQAHGHILNSLETENPKDECKRWDQIFSFKNKHSRNDILSSYRSITANFLIFSDFLERIKISPHLSGDANKIRVHLSSLLNRISEYGSILQAVLDISLPSEPSYDSLCTTTFHMQDAQTTIDEVGRELRTMWSSSILKARLTRYDDVNVDDFGLLLLDDRLVVDHISGAQFSVFLFEKVLLFCKAKCQAANQTQYPIKSWEMGPALAETTPLTIIHSIPTEMLKSLHCIDIEFFEVVWGEENGHEHSQTFHPLMPLQYEQWVGLLRRFVTFVDHSTSNPKTEFGEIWFLNEDEYEDHVHYSSVAKSWSLRGRKDPHSENSSVLQKDQSDRKSLLLSPNLLPTLFNNMLGIPKSPLSVKSMQLNSNDETIVKISKGDSKLKINMVDEKDTMSLLDLTGGIEKEGKYPAAHGGYSDVWKGIWKRDGSQVQVAVKVLRATIRDPEVEEKLTQGVRRELHIWKKLNHPHILELYGVTSDFGPYISMVCPWLNNGTVGKYMEHCGDILSVSDRLNLLNQVADGLAYLHSFSIIHGDLSGSNILIDDDGNARLSDFGLSSIVMELHGTANITSTFGGSVRWADPLFYKDYEEDQVIIPTTSSDIYSFGSVMLEILSGRIPYHYLSNDVHVVIELNKGIKPRRPTHPFVDDAQWNLIQHCWADRADDRPHADDVRSAVHDLLVQYSGKSALGIVK
ncbi:hypothetical protein BDQ12DRAFT_658509 [Crucibulum laeve]|uniref:Protein kinase domain-containing protein n=1 Tax=Crucibulum laeve TaxID=68775 RepID=A0A5C3LJV4_9AGAR|nr:hypothetical protein BDQ12DRAFT_658509 [Crucibulum laeve]